MRFSDYSEYYNKVFPKVNPTSRRVVEKQTGTGEETTDDVIVDNVLTKGIDDIDDTPEVEPVVDADTTESDN